MQTGNKRISLAMGVVVFVGLACESGQQRIEPSPVFLKDLGVDARFATIAAKGPIRWAPEGAPINAKNTDPPAPLALEVALLEERGPSVRVLVNQFSWRAALWIDRRFLRHTVTRTVILRAPEPKSDLVGITLYPGVALTLGDRTDGFTRVSGTVGQITFHGWAPDDAMGQIYRRSTGSAVPLTEGIRLLPRAEIISGSAGTTIASVGALPMAVGRGVPDEGRESVTVAQDHVTIKGWVAQHQTEQLEELAQSFFGIGNGVASADGLKGIGTWGTTSTAKTKVPKGTMLRSGPRADVIGVTTGDLLLPREANGSVGLMTSWGLVSAWIGKE